uniref:GRAM domain-containing protein n=1 Tax=Acrobeloides nanus TaxID=290746 RepID=A0A914CPM4_9BILA
MVWIKPEHILVGQSFWVNERANPYFLLQRRKGHGTTGLSSLFVATVDSVFDTRPAPYRILYQHTNDDIQLFIAIANAIHHSEIIEHWDWLEKNLLPTLSSFETEEDVRRFVLTKVEGLRSLEETSSDIIDEGDYISTGAVVYKFQKIFDVPIEEKLVNYYTCTYWKGKVPCQGKLFLSVNFLCFYSFLVGNQTKIKIRWTEVTKLEKNNSLLLPQSLQVVTRDASYNFSTFMNFNETYKLAVQLANLAMKQLIEEEGFCEDATLRQKFLTEGTKKSTRNNSTFFVKRDLDARQRSEMYRYVNFYHRKKSTLEMANKFFQTSLNIETKSLHPELIF